MPNYCTLDDLRARLGSTKTTRDGVLSDEIDTAEAQIDDYCGRNFLSYTRGGNDFATDSETRLFCPSTHSWSWVDDFVYEDGDTTVEYRESLTGSWTAWTKDTHFQIEPLNQRKNEKSWPTELIRMIDGYSFTVAEYPTLRITARFGWPSVPTAIKRATLLQASKLFDREDSPAGTLGFDGFGAVVRVSSGLDRDTEKIVAPYRRMAEY